MATGLSERIRVAVRDWLLQNGGPVEGAIAQPVADDVRFTSATLTPSGPAGDPYAESSSPATSDRAVVDALNELATGLSITCIYLDKEARVIEFAAPWVTSETLPATIESVAREIAKRILETDVPEIVRTRLQYRMVALK
jgi:hypothetical protein